MVAGLGVPHVRLRVRSDADNDIWLERKETSDAKSIRVHKRSAFRRIVALYTYYLVFSPEIVVTHYVHCTFCNEANSNAAISINRSGVSLLLC